MGEAREHCGAMIAPALNWSGTQPAAWSATPPETEAAILATQGGGVSGFQLLGRNEDAASVMRRDRRAAIMAAHPSIELRLFSATRSATW